MANAAAYFLRVIFLVQLEITFFHLKDLGMAFIAFHFSMRFMAEGYGVRPFRRIGYIPAAYLLGLNAGYRKPKKTEHTQYDDYIYPEILFQYLTSFPTMELNVRY